jgi:arylsulfatase A-like enzyme
VSNPACCNVQRSTSNGIVTLRMPMSTDSVRASGAADVKDNLFLLHDGNIRVTAHSESPLDGVSLPLLSNVNHRFPRPLHWRMNHRGQRALRDGAWKYLRVDGHDYLFDLSQDERERANLAPRQPERLAAMRADWEAWNATMPPIPADATISLGYGAKDMPQR